jgi:hypothetical protein
VRRRQCHRRQDATQWLYVVDGQGVAKINGRRYPLRAGALLMIEPKDGHEIRNTGKDLLKTVNFYTGIYGGGRRTRPCEAVASRRPTGALSSSPRYLRPGRGFRRLGTGVLDHHFELRVGLPGSQALGWVESRVGCDPAAPGCRRPRSLAPGRPVNVEENHYWPS